MSVAKGFTIVLWIACIACFFTVSNSGLVLAGRITFWFLLVAHTIEFFVYLPGLRRIGGSLPGHLFQVLLFGIVYWREVRPQQSSNG